MIKDPETGVIYHTLKDFCKFKGINYGAFYRAKYVKGFSVEEALNYVRDAYSRWEDPYTGKKYKHLSSIIRLHSEVSAPVVRRRLQQGMDLITAMKDLRPIYKDHLGNTFPSLNAMAKFHGIDPNKVRRRLNTGYPINVALSPDNLPDGRSKLRKNFLFGNKSVD